MLYRWCELGLRADFELPELPRSSSGLSPEWSITLGEGAPPSRPGREWFHEWEFPDGRKWVAFARDAGGYLLRFPDLVEFDVVPHARAIGIYAQPTAPAHTVRHLLLDQVLPLLAGDADRLVLHGSVVATDQGAVVFLADSGRGKSTLAARLARHGNALVSDDCCLLLRTTSGFDVVSSYPGVRLAPDSVNEVFGSCGESHVPVAHYTDKRRVVHADGLPFRDGRLPLAKIYVIGGMEELETASDVGIVRRTPRGAISDLLSYTFHLDVRDTRRLHETFDLAADVALRHEVKSLVFPWEFSKLDAVAEAILGDR